MTEKENDVIALGKAIQKCFKLMEDLNEDQREKVIATLAMMHYPEMYEAWLMKPKGGLEVSLP